MKNAFAKELLFVGRIQEFEGQSSDEGAREFRDDVNPNVREIDQLHQREAERDGGIKRAARDCSDGERADHHRHADGQAVERIAGSVFGGGRIQDNKSERESEEKLGHENQRDVLDFHRHAALAHEKEGDERRGDAGEELRHPVGNHVLRIATPSNKNGQRDRRIEVATGDVPSDVNHDHERATDRERRDDASRAGNDGAADGEDEEKSADKFCEVFFHFCFFGLVVRNFRMSRDSEQGIGAECRVEVISRGRTSRLMFS